LIDNYTLENYRFWKRCIVLTGCAYICLLMTSIKIDNYFIILNIVQYAICFLIIEQFEQQRVQRWIKDYNNQPKLVKEIQ
jgi:hypothetical protein